jgi:hypothetical protein
MSDPGWRSGGTDGRFDLRRGAQMFNKILLADGWESSAKAVDHVEDQARAMDSEVLVID